MAEEVKLTNKQKRFCDEYLVDLNATQAAVRSGYSVKTAYSIGYENLRKPEISEYITQKLKEKSLSAEETIKLISDISKSSLNDFFTINKREYTPRVIRPLDYLIKQLEEEIIFEDEFATEVQFNKSEKKAHEETQKYRRNTLVKYRLELKRNPEAKRIVDGETILIDHAELDLVKLVKAKENGRIKSLSHTQFGVKVELYAADAALIAMARKHGQFIDKTVLSNPDGSPIAQKQVFIINGKEIEF